MSTLLDRFGDIFSIIMSPLWNNPERMQKLSRDAIDWIAGLVEPETCLRIETDSSGAYCWPNTPAY